MSADRCTGLYLCDLARGIDERELRHALSFHGTVVAFHQVDCLGDASLLVDFSTAEAASDAQAVLNYASFRGKTCRCLPTSALEAMQRNGDEGHRLVIEGLASLLESQGLRDVCALFGEVLDCKVERRELNGTETSRGVGFVHYAEAASAEKATTHMAGMMLGDSVIELRPFVPADAALFTGSCLRGSSDDNANGAIGVAAALQRLEALSDASAHAKEAWEIFKALESYSVEVLADREAKLVRLKEVIEECQPSHDRQLTIVVDSINLQAVMATVGECVEESDHGSVGSATPSASREQVFQNFMAGNLYVLVLSSGVALQNVSNDECGGASMLISFDFAYTLPEQILRIQRNGKNATHVREFFVQDVDGRLAAPLADALRLSGREVSSALADCLVVASPSLDTSEGHGSPGGREKAATDEWTENAEEGHGDWESKEADEDVARRLQADETARAPLNKVEDAGDGSRDGGEWKTVESGNTPKQASVPPWLRNKAVRRPTP